MRLQAKMLLSVASGGLAPHSVRAFVPSTVSCPSMLRLSSSLPSTSLNRSVSGRVVARAGSRKNSQQSRGIELRSTRPSEWSAAGAEHRLRRRSLPYLGSGHTGNIYTGHNSSRRSLACMSASSPPGGGGSGGMSIIRCVLLCVFGAALPTFEVDFRRTVLYVVLAQPLTVLSSSSRTVLSPTTRRLDLSRPLDGHRRTRTSSISGRNEHGMGMPMSPRRLNRARA